MNDHYSSIEVLVVDNFSNVRQKVFVPIFRSIHAVQQKEDSHLLSEGHLYDSQGQLFHLAIVEVALHDCICEIIWNGIFLHMRTYPSFLVTDFLGVVIYEVSRGYLWSTRLEIEGAKHAESWCTNQIDLEVMVLLVKTKFTFPDDISCFIPDESIVNYTVFINCLFIFVGCSIQQIFIFSDLPHLDDCCFHIVHAVHFIERAHFYCKFTVKGFLLFYVKASDDELVFVAGFTPHVLRMAVDLASRIGRSPFFLRGVRVVDSILYRSRFLMSMGLELKRIGQISKFY